MTVGVPKEKREGEKRVALIPDHVKTLTSMGMDVLVEKGAGEGAFFTDRAYEEAGAKVVDGVFGAGIILKVNPPEEEEVEGLEEGSLLVGFLNPFGRPSLIKRLSERKVTALAMELIPRISRAQAMDALSSQASVAGYKAVLMAADSIQKFFPMLTTAAGTIPPARVFVIGAGVAGLQAIATAKRLGAIVEAFDIRPEVKEEVESLGGRFVMVEAQEEVRTEGGYAKEVSERTKEREREVLAEHIKAADAVITTALTAGRKAPILITEEMVSSMKPGSIIIDLAAEGGGNCELTRPGETVTHGDVKVIGPVNLPSTMAHHASRMYGKNLLSLLREIIKDGQVVIDLEDEVIGSICVVYRGEIRNRRVLEALERRE